MYSNQLQSSQESQSEQVMSCLEHERLTVKDFSYSEDFDYLIRLELPCFGIEVKQGSLVLIIKHYLAKILLPSGISLEVLPKVGAGYSNNSFEHQLIIKQSRAWVARMLMDIAADNLLKSNAAIDLGVAGVDNIQKDYSVVPLHISKKDLSGITSKSKVTSNTNILPLDQIQFDQPWYEGLLNIAKNKMSAAAGLLPNQYQNRVNNNTKAQGKINFKAQLKTNWHRPHYLYSEQAVFTPDILLAQFLGTGWHQLQVLSKGDEIKTFVGSTPVSYRSVNVLKSTEWLGAYNQIKNRSAGWYAQMTPLQRETLSQAIEWCWWLLNHINITSGINESASSKLSSGPALMINMNHAFERWILGKLAIYVKQSLPKSQLIIHPKFDWLVSHIISNESQDAAKEESSTKTLQRPKITQRLIPDACIRNPEGKITHVIDIKYKAIDTAEQVSGADWQQIYVYKQHLNCLHAWLIYPMSERFTQRLDVLSSFEENSQPYHHDSGLLSVIPFNMMHGQMLI